MFWWLYFKKRWQNSEWNICSNLVIIANSRLWADECWFRFSLCVFFCMLSFPHQNCYKLLLFLLNALVCFISNFYLLLYFFLIENLVYMRHNLKPDFIFGRHFRGVSLIQFQHVHMEKILRPFFFSFLSLFSLSYFCMAEYIQDKYSVT